MARARIRDGESGSLPWGLDVPPIVGEIGNELGVRQWLIRTAHDAKADVNISAFHECGNNSVERALAWGQCVWIVGVQDEQFSAIAQRETHATNHHP